MKLLLLPFLSGITLLPLTNQPDLADKAIVTDHYFLNNETAGIKFQEGSAEGKMACIAFKAQDYCRAELKDFDFDAHFSIVSATVYFSGANFKTVEKGFITSSSLKPIKHLMARCLPGTRVIFDDVKVKGPDDTRIIEGKNLLLY